MARTLPKKLTELGRIRIGSREANKHGRGTHPHKLDTFRLTSSNGSLLHFAASAYGGEVQPWTGEGAPMDEYNRPTQCELYTTVNALEVLIPTFSAMSLSFEQWSAGGCQRRCTGEFITHCPLQEALVGSACTCPAEEHARAELAKTGKACARILRLNVLLPDLPGMGVWRLETKGFYATAELMGTLEMLQMAGQEHTIIEAVLRLEQRTAKRLGKGEGKGTLQFAVPVLWPKFSPRQMLSAAAERGGLLMTPAMPKPALQPLIAAGAGGDGGGEDPLVQRIDDVLIAHGLEAEERATWWARMDNKYAGRSPMTLTMLYEQLQERVAQLTAKTTTAAQVNQGATNATQDAPQAWEGAQGPSWGPESPNLCEEKEAAAQRAEGD